MKRGRAGRRRRYKRTGHIRGSVWLVSALAAAAVIYGVVEFRTGKGHEAGKVQVSLDTPVSGQDIKAARNTGETAKSGSETKKQEIPWNIRVVDVKDSVPVEIPPEWQETTDDLMIEQSFRKKAAELAGQWDSEPVDSQMESFDKETGTYRYSEAVSGRRLDQDKLAADLMKAFKENDRQASVQAIFRTIPPSRTQAQAKEMYKVIGTFSTTTTNNQNRNQNIRLAAEAIDGMVLQPGQEFSFNMATGNRTSDKGYQPAGAYRNGILIEEPGGGVCQVSTTLYHAIVNSGFKTTERNNHSFAPGYIEKGQDAMVSFDGYAGPDLRFVNTGNASVGLRASFGDNKLKLSIVGLPVLEDGKNVSMRSEKVKDLEPPEPTYEENPELTYGEEKVIQQAQPGSVWRTYRQLKENGQVVEETLLNTSTYKAKAAVIERNSAALPPEEAPLPSESAEQAAEGQNVPVNNNPEQVNPGAPSETSTDSGEVSQGAPVQEAPGQNIPGPG